MRLATSPRRLAAIGALSATLISPPTALQLAPARGVVSEEPLAGRTEQMVPTAVPVAASLSPEGTMDLFMLQGGPAGFSSAAFGAPVVTPAMLPTERASPSASTRSPATPDRPVPMPARSPGPSPAIRPGRGPVRASSPRSEPARAPVARVTPVRQTALRFAGRVSSLPGMPGPAYGLASTYGPGYGDLIAVPHRGRWLVRIMWHGRYVVRSTNDYGPNQLVYPSRVIDLDVATFQALSGESWARGILSGVTVEYLRYLGA